MKKNVVIVDDHILVANALSGIISNFVKFEVLYICENGVDLQIKLKTGQLPDIVLLDVSMPIMNGFETAQWLKEFYPNISIMVLSMQNDDASLIKMIKNGAKGYMLKNILPTELELALNTLVEKGRYFPEWAEMKVFQSVCSDHDEEEENIKLSNREIEFLKFTTTEMNYKEIAERMFCSPRTIENYRNSLFEKLELKSRVGLAVYAIRNGYSI